MAQINSETNFDQSLSSEKTLASESSLTTDNELNISDRQPIQPQDTSGGNISEHLADNKFPSANLNGEFEQVNEINNLMNSTLILDSSGENDEHRSVNSSRDDAASRSNASSPASLYNNARSSAPSSLAESATVAAEPSVPPAMNQNPFNFTDVNQMDVNRVRQLINALKDPRILSRFNNDDVKTLINEFTTLCKYYETQLQLRTAIASVAFASDPTQQRQTPSSIGSSGPFGGSARSTADSTPKSFESEQVGRQSFPTPPPQVQYAPPLVARGFPQAAPSGAPRAFNTPQPTPLSASATMTPQNMQVRHQLAFATPQAPRGGGVRPNPDAPIFVPGTTPGGEAQFRMPGAMSQFGSVAPAPFGRPMGSSGGLPTAQPLPANDPRSLANAAQGRSHEMLSQLFPNASPNSKGEMRFNQPPMILPPGFPGLSSGPVGPLSGPEASGGRIGLQPATGPSNESLWPAEASQQAGYGRSASANYPQTGAHFQVAPGSASAPVAAGGGAVAGGAARGFAPPPSMMPPAQATAGEGLITATAAIPSTAGTSGTPGPPQQFTVSIMAQPTIFRVGGGPNGPRYSRKVFVGGLPPDVDEREIVTAFKRFGPCVVDWPHKTETKSYFPPKGYCFVIFQEESSVHQLIGQCASEDDKLYWIVSSPTSREKLVQIRPWDIADADTILDPTKPLDPRKTVFVGGVPRPLKSRDLAVLMNELLQGVVYAGIDTDPELKYPKGAGRVSFDNYNSYLNAINSRFVHVKSADMDKRMEVKPYVLDDQMCDECSGANCGGQYAPYFCSNVSCLQYYCEPCWRRIHSLPGRENHRPLIKEGSEHRIEKHTRILQQLVSTQLNQQPSLASHPAASGGAKSLLGERSPLAKQPAGGSGLHTSASGTGRMFGEFHSPSSSGGLQAGNDTAHSFGASGGIMPLQLGFGGPFAKPSPLSTDSANFPQAAGASSISPKASGAAAIDRTLDSLFQQFTGGSNMSPHS